MGRTRGRGGGDGQKRAGVADRGGAGAERAVERQGACDDEEGEIAVTFAKCKKGA